MSDVKHGEFSRVLRVFISSSTTEMELFRNQAIQAVRDAGMQHTNFNDPGGAGISHRNQTIFEMNRDTIRQADVFVGLYGFGGVWEPASHPGLTEVHPELMDDPHKLIMEYEYEWAREAGLLMFPFVRTDQTTGAPMIDMHNRMHRFRLRVMASNVGWLTTPAEFYSHLSSKLQAIKPRVFISYSRKNEAHVSELQRQLRYADVFTWRDKTNIAGSSEWASALEAALGELEAMIVVVTPESVCSTWVEKECRKFQDMGKRVFPYIVDPEYVADPAKLPDYLEKLQYIDGTASDGFDDLVRQLRGVLDA